LYEGEVGKKLTDYICSAGGLLSLEDLRRCSADWVEPVRGGFDGHEIFVMPPNSYGVLMLMQLQSLAALPKEQLDGDAVTRLCWQMRAMRAAFSVGQEEIGDPSSMRIGNQHFLEEGTIGKVRARMFGQPGAPQTAPCGGTACVTVADALGNAVSIVQSIFNPFGAHFMDPNTGIILNNRMFGFDHMPGRVNSIGPGKRSAHTLNPVMVTKEGELRWVYASPGGISQTITGMQVLVNLITRRLGICQAIHTGRWAVDRGGNILVEPTMPEDVLAALAAAGLPARHEEDGYLFGSVTVIQRDSATLLRAAADTRREASAMAV
jgi:gamma-glutamyltranspeptidase/glutathione hydrolase